MTSNHIHLLVRDRGHGEIASSMQLVAGRTAQAYNLRKRRSGAFWEDRYHATAVDTGEHLARCVVYIDLNMVRAGAVDHPAGHTPRSELILVARSSGVMAETRPPTPKHAALPRLLE